jgi:Domain of unknown function (DUF1996)
MISGDSRLRSYDNNTLTYNNGQPIADRVSFHCIDSSEPNLAEEPHMFRTNCDQGLRAQILFQSCWDGVNTYLQTQLKWPIKPRSEMAAVLQTIQLSCHCSLTRSYTGVSTSTKVQAVSSSLRKATLPAMVSMATSSTAGNRTCWKTPLRTAFP